MDFLRISFNNCNMWFDTKEIELILRNRESCAVFITGYWLTYDKFTNKLFVYHYVYYLSISLGCNKFHISKYNGLVLLILNYPSHLLIFWNSNIAFLLGFYRFLYIILQFMVIVACLWFTADSHRAISAFVKWYRSLIEFPLKNRVISAFQRVVYKLSHIITYSSFISWSCQSIYLWFEICLVLLSFSCVSIYIYIFYKYFKLYWYI